MRRASVLIVAAATAACGLSGPDLSHAAAMFWCGPADGPATRIVLARDPVASAEPSFPYVSVLILQPVGDISPQTWDITTAAPPGVWYVRGPNTFESPTSGNISVTSVDATHRVIGSVDLRFPSRAIETAFSAPWINSGITCP